MQNRKIYISTYDDINNPHYGGGGAIAVHEVAKQLVKKYDLCVISWDYCGKKKEIIDGVPYERFGSKNFSPKFAMFAYQVLLPFIARGKDFDVWLESFCPPFTTSMMPFFTKKPVIGIVHMLAAEDMERKYKLPFRMVQNMGLKMYTHLIVTSDALRKKVKKIHSSGSFSVISNGISFVSKPKYKKEPYILFLGRIEIDQKGIDLLLDAFKKLNDLNKYKLLIVGDGDPNEISKLKSLIKKEKIAKNVILKGKVTGDPKYKLLRNASCIVVPSRFETYSLVSLEAMANGTPVICFDLEGLSWIPTKAAKKVKSIDGLSLSLAISEVLSNKKISETMIKEGNMYAKNFTWEKVSKQYDEYILKIIRSNSK